MEPMAQLSDKRLKDRSVKMVETCGLLSREICIFTHLFDLWIDIFHRDSALNQLESLRWIIKFENPSWFALS